MGAESHAETLRPGDSAYIAPLVEHKFSVMTCSGRHAVGYAMQTSGDRAQEQSVVITRPGLSRDCGSTPNPNGKACADGRRLLIVRIPGHLTGETLAQFATFSAH